jgi:signal peptidase II
MSSCRLTSSVKQRNIYIPILILLVTIGTDQYTKFLAGQLFETYNEISLLNNFFKFSFVENHGGFLGIVSNLPENIRFFLLNICVSLLLLGCLIYLFYSHKRIARYDMPLVFVVGGGMSNLLDRLLHDGGVTDFLSIGIDNFRTGIFNLADVYILIGSFVIGYYLLSSSAKSA